MLPNIAISLSNNGKAPLEQHIAVGVVPYTNEGVGIIRSTQFTSDFKLIVNDASIIESSIPQTTLSAPNLIRAMCLNAQKNGR